MVGYAYESAFETVFLMTFEVLMWSAVVCWRILGVVLWWEIQYHPRLDFGLLRHCFPGRMLTQVGMKVRVSISSLSKTSVPVALLLL